MYIVDDSHLAKSYVEISIVGVAMNPLLLIVALMVLGSMKYVRGLDYRWQLENQKNNALNVNTLHIGNTLARKEILSIVGVPLTLLKKSRGFHYD